MPSVNNAENGITAALRSNLAFTLIYAGDNTTIPVTSVFF